MIKSSTILIAAGVAAIAGSAHGAVITHTGSKPISTTSWSDTFNVPQFDDQGGLRILDQVKLTLTGDVEGDANVESLNQGPSVVMLNLQATITMSLMGDTLGVVIPVANESFNAATFDGTVDFMGPSGAMFPDLAGTDMTMTTLVNGVDDLTPFIGLGTIGLDATAVGTSNGSGAGNLILQFFTDAGLDYEIEYTYTLVPTPAAAGLLALCGIAGSTRRRR